MGVAAVITSGKGGVGKSTVTVGIGRALADRGRRVLLMDCDAGLRSLDRMTGVEAQLVFDSADVVHGRCAPLDAIYPVQGEQELFLLPAPSSAQEAIAPAIMKKLVPMLKEYYDYVLLDSPAGLGRGFHSAACCADKALIVCSPDPVCVRGTGIVRDMLQQWNVMEQGLVINRFNPVFFSETGVYKDLDAVIDDAQVRLFGVVPEDFSLAAAFLRGNPAGSKSKGMMALSRFSARLEGEMVPIILD